MISNAADMPTNQCL